MPNPKIHRVPLGKKNSTHPKTLSLILTPSPNRVNPRRKKGKGKRERADLAYLAAAQCCCLAGVRGEEEAKSGRRGQAARRRRDHPLGSAHAGEGAGDGARAPPIRRPLESLGD